jgi:glyoxylase-like metal-dependent hydrolase (beta-lactamase superfamily II)
MTTPGDTLTIEGRPGGPLMTMTYALTDTATGLWAMVDPTYDTVQTWADRLARSAPQAVWLTHGHFDHCGGLTDLLEMFPDLPVWVHPDGLKMVESAEHNGAIWVGMGYEPAAANRTFTHGDELTLGRTRVRVLEAPGHCPGSVMLLAGRHLLAGDVLFQGSVGRWDLPGASYDVLAATIREQAMTLPDETVVYPGHGPATTIGEERRHNSIVRDMLAGRRP